MKITFSDIEAHELADTGSWLDAQDPAVQITIKEKKKMTDRMKDAKSDAVFTNVLEFEVSDQEYETEKVEIEAFNVGKLSNTSLGIHAVPLKQLLPRQEEKIACDFQLMYKGKQKGKIKLSGKVEKPPEPKDKPKEEEKPKEPEQPKEKPKDPEKPKEKPKVEEKAKEKPKEPEKPKEEEEPKNPVVAAPVEPQQPNSGGPEKQGTGRKLKLSLSNLKCEELFDTGSFMDKQDPMLSLKFGSHTLQTKRVKDAGKNVSFPELFELDIDEQEYLGGLELEAEVFNVNMAGSKTHVGKGRVVLSGQGGIPKERWGKQCECRVPLVHEKGKGKETPQGTLIFSGLIVDPAQATPPPVKEQPKEPPQEQPKEEEKEKEAASPSHSEGANLKLSLSNLKCEELFDTGSFMDKQDPMLSLKIGSHTLQTKRVKDAGTEVSFPEQFEVEIPRIEYEKGLELEAEVFNVNMAGSKTHVGKGRVVLSGQGGIPKERWGKQCECRVPLVHEKGKGKETPQGTLIFSGLIVDPAQATPPPEKEQPKEPPADQTEVTAPQTFFVSKVATENLKNVEKMMFDKNDVYLKMRFGDNTWSADTEVQNEAGAMATWTYDRSRDRHMRFTASPQEIRELQLGVDAMDSNKITSHTKIGSGQRTLPAALLQKGTKTCEMVLELKDEKQNATGTVTLTLMNITAEPHDPAKDTSAEGAQEKNGDQKQSEKDFQSGRLRVTKILCSGLPNVEKISFMDKNDPYVTLQLAEDSRKTDVLQEGGSDPVFPDLDINFDVTRDLVDFERLEVTVWDQNKVNDDTNIGSASVSLRLLLAHVGEDRELSVDLAGKGGKSVGTAVLFVRLEKASTLPPDVGTKLPLDPTFERGLLQISQVRGHSLKKQGLFGAGGVSNPFLKLSYGAWTHQTEPLSMAKAGVPVFKGLDLETEVTAAALESNVLAVELHEKGLVGSSLVGKGSCLVRAAGVKVGQEVELTVDLDAKGTVAGRVVVTAKVVLPPPKVDESQLKVAEGFVQGYFQVHTIRAHKLTNLEIMGKQDPYVVLEFGPWTERTKTLQDQGGEATWSDLGLRCDLSRAEVEQPLTVKVFEDNALSKDLLIGQATLSLKRVAVALNTVGELSTDIIGTKNGNVAGHVVLALSLHQEDKPAKVKLPESLLGLLKIRKVVGHQLVSNNRLTAPAPVFKFKYGKWTAETKPGKGSDPTWEYLDLMSVEPLGPSQVREQPLEVEVLEGGKPVLTGKIPHLLPAAVQLGEEVDLPVTLTHVKSGKEGGRGVVTLMLVDPHVLQKEKEEAAKAEAPPEVLPAWKEGILQISHVQVSELKNKEFFGKSDPFVNLQLGDWAVDTEERENAGDDVIWDDVDFRTDVSPQQLIEETLGVAVWDKNTKRSNVLIGRCDLSMRRVAFAPGKELTLTTKLHDEKQQYMGTITLRVELREKVPGDDAGGLPEGFESGLLHIHRISTFELKNTETFGKQDPYIKVKLGDFEAKTPHQDDVGSDTVFERTNFKPEVTASILQNRRLELEAWDYNLTGDRLIGKGSLALLKVRSLNEELELNCVLKDPKGNSAGRLLVFLRLEEKPLSPEKEAEIPVPETFKTGVAYVKMVCGYGFKNTEMFYGSKPDPYVKLQFPRMNWEGETPVLQNAGADPQWDLLDLPVDVDRVAVETGVFLVQVMNKNNLKKDSLVGAGSVPLRKAALKLGQVVELPPVEVLDEKGKVTGTVVLHVELREEEPEGDYKLPADFTFGHLEISRIDAFNLKNTEWTGLQDPYVVLTLGDWTEKTFTKDEGGSNVSWKFLGLQTDVYKETLEAQTLQVRVFDDNCGRPDVEIGHATVSLMKCGAKLGQEVELKVPISDDKDQPTGKVVLFASVKLPEPEVEVPVDFEEGSLKIKRVSAFGLENSEFLGLTKGDPYLRLKLEKFSADTKVQNNAGANPIWDYLDLETTVPAKVVKVGELEVEVWDKNTLKDTLVASCKIPVRPVAGKMGEEVELRGMLATPKGKSSGRIVILTQLTPMAKVVKPTLELPKDFTVGQVTITKIRTVGLLNKEIFGSQDPYVRVSIGDWTETTVTKNNAGSEALWTDLDMCAEVNEQILLNEKIELEVLDENTAAQDQTLGSGKVSMRKLCAMLGSAVEYSVDLVQPNGAVAGAVHFTARLSQGGAEDAADALPDSAVTVKKGLFCIQKVTVFDIVGGDSTLLGGKQDPYVTLQLGDWSAKTDFRPNAGRNATWDIDDMEVPITSDTLRLQRLGLTVWDQNNLGDTWIGKGDQSLKRWGSEMDQSVTHKIRLKDKRGRSAGRLEVTAVVKPFPEQPAAAKGEPTEDSVGLIKMGALRLRKLAVDQMKSGSLISKQDLFVSVKAVDWTASTPVQKGAGSKAEWDFPEESSALAVAQLLSKGLRVAVFSKGMTGNSQLGEAVIPLQSVANQPLKWVSLKTDLKDKQKQFAGKLRVQACFVALDADESKIVDELSTADAKGKTAEKTLEAEKAMFKKELEEERNKWMESIAAQNKALTESLDRLSTGLLKQQQPRDREGGTAVRELKELKLPTDTSSWRSAHVQVWVSFHMELPQYMESFREASVDGLVLLRHLNDDTLSNALDVHDHLHRQKLLEGIRALQQKQRRIDAQQEKERLSQLKSQREEEERKFKVMADFTMPTVVKKPKEKVKVKTKKVKKKKVKPTPATVTFGDVREQSVVDRARIEQQLKQAQQERLRQQNEADKHGKTWNFEYTGAPKPKVESLWDTDPFSKPEGTKAYRKNVTLDILNSKAFTSAPEGDMSGPPKMSKVRHVPTNCSPEELLVVVKAAMYDVSGWLQQVEQLEKKRQRALDSDLLDSRDPTLLQALAHTDKTGNSNAKDSGEPDLEEEEYEPPPSYMEVTGTVPPNRSTADSEQANPPLYDEFSFSQYSKGSRPAPGYEDLFPADPQGDWQPPSPPSAKILELLSRTEQQALGMDQDSVTERMTLVFQALVGQKNNNARWLGSNSKLTRMKFYGGLESLLRLKVEWAQFDALWTDLDYRRSGDIDLVEFKKFFGDLSEFENLQGTLSLTTKSKSTAITALTRCLFDLCDALRHAGFTVVEMFSGFDRNGSGSVSMSEFCSLLRLVVGKDFDKRLIYQALAVLDVDGDKSISLDELLRFVYRTWKSQLDELAEQLVAGADEGPGEAARLSKVVNERAQIKAAVKKNFPRSWRDQLEREGGHSLPGPFQNLMSQLDLGEKTRRQPTGADPRLSQSAPFDRSSASATGGLNLSSPPKPKSAVDMLLHSSGQQRPDQAEQPHTPWSPAPSKKPNYASQTMRFRIRVPAASAPTRPGATLGVPPVRVLDGPGVTGDISKAVLGQSSLRGLL